MIIYIAGKMKGLPDKGREKFDATADKLKSEGNIVLNPAGLPDGMPGDRYMPICLAMVSAADAVYALEDWPLSNRAVLEVSFAIYQGKKVLFQTQEE